MLSSDLCGQNLKCLHYNEGARVRFPRSVPFSDAQELKGSSSSSKLSVHKKLQGKASDKRSKEGGLYGPDCFDARPDANNSFLLEGGFSETCAQNALHIAQP